MKLEQGIAKKEAEKDQLMRKVTGKQKKSDSRPFGPNYLKFKTGLVKQQMKTVMMVEGTPKWATSKTRFRLSNVSNNA